VKSSVDNDGEFELDALGRTEPVETGESICNMLRATETSDDVNDDVTTVLYYDHKHVFIQFL